MFKKLKLFIFSFLFIFGGLQAEIEYDIFVLADEHHEFSPSKTHQLTEDDYILGRSQKWTPLVYHFPSQTFFELSNIKGEAVSINRNGLVAGTFSKNNTNDGVFVYNIHTHEFVDVLNHPDLYEMGGHFIVIGITDDNTVFVRSAKGAFSYNYDLQTVTLKIRDTIKAVNGNGQTMGGGFSEISLTNDKGWFLDPGSEYDDLGSIHELGRLPVLPLMMSENGFVAGTAYESDGFYPNRKAFIWNKETGLIKVDVEMVDFLGMAGINNKGEVVGSYDDQIKEKSGAFLITAEKEVVDLGVLGILDAYSVPLDINDFLQVIGSSVFRSYKDGPYEARAFVWDKENEMRDLIEFIPSNTGWEKLISANHINNQGRIVGYGIYKGKGQIFLLVPKK